MPKKTYQITTLSPLPVEIRLQILDDLDLVTDKSALAVFARLSRSFHQKTIPKLYHSVSLSARNATQFFSGLPRQSVMISRAEGQASLSEEERQSWWEGKLQDKRSSTARRLCLLGFVRELVFEDLFAIRACDQADRALGSLGLAKPPESWYPPEARYWPHPQPYYVFHGDVPLNIRFRVFIPQNPYEGVSAESVPKHWQQLFIAKLSKQCSTLSLPQPEPGSEMFNHFGSMFACISSKPVLCFEDVDPSVFLPIAAYRIQPLVILRLRDEKDCREPHWTGVLKCLRNYIEHSIGHVDLIIDNFSNPNPHRFFYPFYGETRNVAMLPPPTFGRLMILEAWSSMGKRHMRGRDRVRLTLVLASERKRPIGELKEMVA